MPFQEFKIMLSTGSGTFFYTKIKNWTLQTFAFITSWLMSFWYEIILVPRKVLAVDPLFSIASLQQQQP